VIGSSGESFESRLVGVVDEVKLYTRPLTEAEVLLFDNSWNRSVCASAYNHPPVVDAGADQTITMPTNAVTLSGTVTDDGLPAGSTLSLMWSQVSGPAPANFSNPGNASTSVSFSVAGTYVLRLAASDSQFTVSDDVVVTVNPGTVNQAPIVNAGPNQTITLPATATLAGTAADDGLPTGSTLSVAWSKVSGPGTVTFTNPNAAATTASFSAAGTYVLRLTASDTALTNSDDAVITINPAIVNQPPTVNTGANQSATIGANLLSNPGNEAALVNGQIPGWTQVSGAWTQATAGVNGFPASVTGSTYFYAGNSATAELRQDVDVSAFAASIANGTQQFEFKAYYRTKDETPADRGQVIIEYRDATNTQVIAMSTSMQN